MMMDVSVVIPAMPKDYYLNHVVSSVKSQKGIKAEVIVVFNPYLPPWGYKGVRVLSSPEGANCARNIGLQSASSDLVYFLDSDSCFETENDLAIRVQKMSENPEWAAAGGLYKILPESSLITKAYNHIQNNWLLINIQNIENRAAYLVGGNMLLRRSKIGDLRFDPELKYGGTEKEFFCRLRVVTQQIFLLQKWENIHLGEISLEQFKYKAKMQARGSRYIENKGVEFTPIKKNIFAPIASTDIIKYINLYNDIFYAEMKRTTYFKNKILRRFQHTIDRYIEQLSLIIEENNQSKSP